MSKMLKIKTTFGSEEEVFFTTNTYANNGNLAVQIMSMEKDGDEEYAEPYAMLTVNLHPLYNKRLGFIDTNNLYSNIVKVMEKNGLIKACGVNAQSGFCSYPLYEFSEDFVNGNCEYVQ